MLFKWEFLKYQLRNGKPYIADLVVFVSGEKTFFKIAHPDGI